MGSADDGDNNDLKTTTIVTPLSKTVLPLLKIWRYQCNYNERHQTEDNEDVST